MIQTQDKFLPAMQKAGIPLESLPVSLGGSHQGRPSWEMIEDGIAERELVDRIGLAFGNDNS